MNQHLAPYLCSPCHDIVSLLCPHSMPPCISQCPQVLPVEYGGQAEMLPIDKARRHFKLPPFDGRKLEEVAVSSGEADQSPLSPADSDDDLLEADLNLLVVDDDEAGGMTNGKEGLEVGAEGGTGAAAMRVGA